LSNKYLNEKLVFCHFDERSEEAYSEPARRESMTTNRQIFYTLCSQRFFGKECLRMTF
jgi:hypothetical protein